MFKKTLKQIEAIRLLSSPAQHILLRGGSRSGKTAIVCYAFIVRASKVKSRHVMLREHFAHIKQSIWMDTLPKVLELSMPDYNNHCKFNQSDFFLSFNNGSEIWIGGLDDKERTEKILGKEFSSIFYNECSSISLNSRNIALTRLSQNNTLKKKAVYDCNPPKMTHWSHKLFVDKIDPDTDKPLSNPNNYVSLLMNPQDNIENIDPDYIPTILENLPPLLRQRFLLGEWGSDDSDIILPSWIIPSNPLPTEFPAKFTFVDPAMTEKERATENSCESAIITMGCDYNNILHDIEVLHGFWSYQQLKDYCVAVNARHKGCSYFFGVEDVAAQRWLHEDLQRLGVNSLPIKPDNDKVRRMISVTDLMEQKRVRINNTDLQKQLLGFPNEKLKDLCDSVCGCLKLYKKYSITYKKPDSEEFIPLTPEQKVKMFQEKRRKEAANRAKGQGLDGTLGRNW